MYDQPDLSDLLDAVRLHLEARVKDAVRHDRTLYFQTLVAINLLKIAGRELALHRTHQKAVWQRLNELQGQDLSFPAEPTDVEKSLTLRHQQLCLDIRNGHFDEPGRKQALFDYLLATTQAQLEVANPGLLETLQREDAHPPTP